MDWYDQQMQRIENQYYSDELTFDEAREESKKVRQMYQNFIDTAVINPRPKFKNDNVIYVEFRR